MKGFLLAASVSVLLGSGRITINWTASMPMGLWASTPVTGPVMPGQVVKICAPSTPETRRYISAGFCPDGLMPLLKPVAAVAGDTVTVTADGEIAVERSGLRVRALHRDASGRPLATPPTGIYHVGPHQVWVISTHSALSFDSRYLGPLPVSSIEAIAKPLLVF